MHKPGKPVIGGKMKYMGSKARFAKEILPIILADRKPNQWYVEPFCGGCNTIDKVDGNRLANDINPYLIAMWVELLTGWIPNEIDKDTYLDIRDNKDKYHACEVGWAGFNCSYSGKYFGGFAGRTRTKNNTVRDYQAEAKRNTLKQIENLKTVIFVSGEYWNFNIPPNSIIYCDPPYQDTTKYSNDFDHDMFWNWVRNKSRLGNTVFVSEYNAPCDFECVWEKQTKSSLSANGKSGGCKVSTEKLFKLKSDVVNR
tara:strand:- start:152 stop:916 length:765 start_codon:yes stop_codon:yes gene_type:complete